jgi:hypothetical protein
VISRYYWSYNLQQEPERHSREAASRGAVSGWLLLGLLSALFIFWLAYRWTAQPSWPDRLPEILREGLNLAQAAGILALSGTWFALLARRHLRPAGPADLARSLEELFAMSPKAFEHYVACLFRKKGYRVLVRGRSGDHGVDLELRAPSGKRAIVQCKRYQSTVGEDVVRELFGTLMHERAARAFLVTSADISPAARDWARGKPITLIDGPTLVSIAAALP